MGAIRSSCLLRSAEGTTRRAAEHLARRWLPRTLSLVLQRQDAPLALLRCLLSPPRPGIFNRQWRSQALCHRGIDTNGGNCHRRYYAQYQLLGALGCRDASPSIAGKGLRVQPHPTYNRSIIGGHHQSTGADKWVGRSGVVLC